MSGGEAMAFRVYTVTKREGEDDFWLPIGAAFQHRDGKGYNLVLQAHPIGDKIVLRVPKEEDATPARKPKDSEREPRGRDGRNRDQSRR